MKLLLLLKTAITLCAIQVVNCRCVCDPADTTCLNNCGNTNEIKSLYVILKDMCFNPFLVKKVNNARNCIEDCGNNTCFTECINFHWPGTTFEDGIADELEEAEESTIRVTSIEKNDATTTAATRATARATPTATTEVDFIGALISAIFNPSIQETTTAAASNLALKTEISDTASTTMLNSATPLSPLSEIASMLNLSNPFLTTSKIFLLLCESLYVTF